MYVLCNKEWSQGRGEIQNAVHGKMTPRLLPMLYHLLHSLTTVLHLVTLVSYLCIENF